jgi:hypothetical protein
MNQYDKMISDGKFKEFENLLNDDLVTYLINPITTKALKS